MAACADVRGKLGQLIIYELQSLLSARQLDCRGELDLLLNLLLRFLGCLEQIIHVLESALDIVKWRFRPVTHATLFGTFPASALLAVVPREKSRLEAATTDQAAKR
jgi:hypothetical protein